MGDFKFDWSGLPNAIELAKKGELHKKQIIDGRNIKPIETNDYTHVAHHKAICDELSELYTKKNKAYGNSFSNSYEKYGLVMSAIRLGDKMNRFETLIRDRTIDASDESVRDTLVDMANYAIMTIMEMDNRQ